MQTVLACMARKYVGNLAPSNAPIDNSIPNLFGDGSFANTRTLSAHKNINVTMSVRFAALNSPALVAGAGTALLVGLPFLQTAAASSAASLVALKGSNAVAFIVNAISVSVPGRIDEAQDQAMRQGALNPSKPTGAPTSETPLTGESPPSYTAARVRSIVNPAGW